MAPRGILGRAKAAVKRRRTAPSVASTATGSAASVAGGGSTGPVVLTALQQETLKKICDLLSEQPDRIFEEYARLTSADAATKKNDDKTWNSTYVYWKSISKSWISNLIAELGSNYGLGQEVLDSIDERCAHSVRHLATHIFGTRMEEKFPRACLDKAVMRQHLIAQAALLGDRHKTFVSRGGLLADKSLNWLKASAYKFEWREGKMVSLTHDRLCGAPKTIDMTQVGISIDTSWELVEPYDDRAARVRQSWLEPHLKDFFKQAWSEDFWAIFDDKALAARATAIKQRIDAPFQQVQGLDVATLVKGPAKRTAEAKAKAKQRANPRAPLKVRFEIKEAA